MRILVADQNALLLAAITATFGPHCDLVTATRRDVCISHVEQHKFDVVIACDKLSDYTGLELLSEVGALSPDTRLIFAANPKRLSQLEKQLAVFGLFEILSYPITPRKLLDVLKRARQSLRAPNKPKVRHVVLESEWDTGVRLGLVAKDLQAQAEAAGRTGHDDWPKEAEVAPVGTAPAGVDADDFVFSGPPVVSPVSEPAAAPRAESRSRTFEATPVGSRATHGTSARSTDPSEVIEYEVKPVVLALSHDTGTIACDDEFIFASSESVPVAASTGLAELIEVEPAGAAVPQQPEPSIEDFCSNDPIFDVPEPPRWAKDGAANDTAYETKSGAELTSSASRHAGAGQPSSEAELTGARGSGPQASSDTSAVQAPRSNAGKASGKAAQAAPSPKAPQQARTRTRKQAVPTEAQRAAFERAVARRNAALGGAPTAAPLSGKARKGVKSGAKTEPTIQAGSMDGVLAGAKASEWPSRSLSELAKMATRKRPLSVSSPNANKSPRPNRAAYAVGSGLAAVVILGVISFELLRNSRQTEQHIPHRQATATQLFSSRTAVLENGQGSGAPQFGPPIQQGAVAPTVAAPPNVPEAQSFDPNTAPEDPPPPPALEQPGPMEPPSEEEVEVHTGPPQGMINPVEND